MIGTGHAPWRPPPHGLDRIGRYRVCAEIGRGGSGSLYVCLAEGPAGFRKLVAVKMLRADLADQPAMVRMLEREAELAARLDHPGIVPVFDLGQDRGVPYLVMDYVHGESLSAVLGVVGALPRAIAVWIGCEICDALAHAHALTDAAGRALELVHRDISPQNILIGYEGTAKLVDFGIARAHDRASDTEVGMVKGRLAYMAPEQREGRAVDRRADLYALGVVLYQATVGVHPFEAGAGGVLPDPRAVQPDYPESLWQVIRTAAAPAAEDRYAGAVELLVALRRVLADLGGPVSRGDVADLMREPFAGRRQAKQHLLDGGAPIGERDTETLAAAAGSGETAPTPDAAGENRPRPTAAPRRRAVALVGGLGLLVGAGALVWWQRGTAGPPAATDTSAAAEPAPPPPRSGRLCLIAGTTGSVADDDAAWAAVRLLGIAFDAHPRLLPIHAYRVQDRLGWTAVGAAEARRACASAAATAEVVVHASPDGSVRADVGGRRFGQPGGHGSERAVAGLARALSAELAGDPDFQPALPGWPDALLHPLLQVREGLALERVLERNEDARKNAFAAIVDADPAFELAFIAEAIHRWLSGALDSPEARATLPRPRPGSPRATALLGAIEALAAGDPARAAGFTGEVLEDRRWADDPLALYLGGEARIHAGQPAEGTRLLERALERDAQMIPAMYHVFEQRLTSGDFAGVDRIADHWDRVDPGDRHAPELRAHALLGAGRYREAATAFEAMLDRSLSDSSALGRPNAGLIWALYLGGDAAAATANARRAAVGRSPAVASAMPEPIGYVIAVTGGDAAAETEWSASARERLAGAWNHPNHWQIAYTMAIIDELAGRSGARARWLGARRDHGVPRRYRFLSHAAVLAALEAFAAGDRRALATTAAQPGLDPVAVLLARGLAAELAGDRPRAAAEQAAALASSASGEFDCVVAAALLRVQRAQDDQAGARTTCARLQRPFVPRPFCPIAARACAPR